MSRGFQGRTNRTDRHRCLLQRQTTAAWVGLVQSTEGYRDKRQRKEESATFPASAPPPQRGRTPSAPRVPRPRDAGRTPQQLSWVSSLEDGSASIVIPHHLLLNTRISSCVSLEKAALPLLSFGGLRICRFLFLERCSLHPLAAGLLRPHHQDSVSVPSREKPF